MRKQKLSKKRTGKLDYGKMNAVQLQTATRQFDRPMVIDDAKPLIAAERGRWKNAKSTNLGGRPRKPSEEKSVRILMTIEPRLLKLADAAAKKRGISRSELFANGIRAVVSK